MAFHHMGTAKLSKKRKAKYRRRINFFFKKNIGTFMQRSESSSLPAGLQNVSLFTSLTVRKKLLLVFLSFTASNRKCRKNEAEKFCLPLN